MVLKWTCLAAVLAISRAGVITPAAPLIAAPVVAAKLSDATHDLTPQYSFGYDVQDALTGDSKAHLESRNGDFVQGQYSLTDPDGTRRIVDYTADPVNGFNAVVRKAALTVAAPLAAKVVAASVPVPASPLVAAAPLAYPTPARLTYPFF